MPHIVHTERTEPKRRLIRTDGALYVVLLLGVFLAIFLSHFLADKLSVSKLYVQIGLYACLLGAGYWLYRVRLVDYLYELYDTDLRVFEIVGKKRKQLLTVPVAAMTEVGPYRSTGAKTEQRTFHGARKKTTAVWFTANGEQRVLCLNASDALKGKLSEAVYAKD